MKKGFSQDITNIVVIFFILFFVEVEGSACESRDQGNGVIKWVQGPSRTKHDSTPSREAFPSELPRSKKVEPYE